MTDLNPLLNHFPDLRAGRGPLIGLTALALFGLASLALMTVDVLWPAWTLAGQVAAVLIGFVVSAQFFWRRKEFRAKYGGLAYRNAFVRFIVPGLPVMFAAIFHTLYLPGQRILTGRLTALTALVGLYFVATGLLLYIRAYRVFGTDNLAMLYVYFPGEGRLVNSSIYGILRHPAYSGAVRMGLAFGLWRGTLWSVLFGLFMPVGLTLWLRLVEEPELIERFGVSYHDYRRSTPAFWPRPKDLGRFYSFLMRGN